MANMGLMEPSNSDAFIARPEWSKMRFAISIIFIVPIVNGSVPVV